MPGSDEGLRPSHAIRLTQRAVDEIDRAASRLTELVSEQVSEEWRAELRIELSKVSANPRQLPLIAEATRFKREVRYLLYRRTPSSVAYRVMFVFSDSDDGPVITVFHVRHASSRPITRRIAEELGSQL